MDRAAQEARISRTLGLWTQMIAMLNDASRRLPRQESVALGGRVVRDAYRRRPDGNPPLVSRVLARAHNMSDDEKVVFVVWVKFGAEVLAPMTEVVCPARQHRRGNHTAACLLIEEVSIRGLRVMNDVVGESKSLIVFGASAPIMTDDRLVEAYMREMEEQLQDIAKALDIPIPTRSGELVTEADVKARRTSRHLFEGESVGVDAGRLLGQTAGEDPTLH